MRDDGRRGPLSPEWGRMGDADPSMARRGTPLLQGRRLFGVRAVAAEVPRGRELTESVADHVFADEHRHMLAAVVDADRVPDHVGIDHRRTGPGADHLLLARSVHLVDLGLQRIADERPFLRRSTHYLTRPFFSRRRLTTF